MFGLALVAPQIILIAIGDKWLNSIPLLQILCLSGAFIPLYSVYQNMLLSLGKSNIYMWLNIGQIALVIGTALACYSLGIKAMVIAFAVTTILWLLAWQFFASRLIGYSFSMMLRDLLPFMFITLAVLAVTYAVTLPFTNRCVLLLARVAIAMALYALTMKVLRAKIFEECIEFIKNNFKKKNHNNNTTSQ